MIGDVTVGRLLHEKCVNPQIRCSMIWMCPEQNIPQAGHGPDAAFPDRTVFQTGINEPCKLHAMSLWLVFYTANVVLGTFSTTAAKHLQVVGGRL